MAVLLQWNIRGLQANFEELKLLANTYKPNVIALQETQLSEGKVIPFTGYSPFFKYCPSGSAVGGCCLYVSNSCLESEVALKTSLQAIARRVTLHKTVTICNLYLPPSEDVKKTDIEELIDQLPRPFILVGDFNAHSSRWGDSKLDRRGKNLENIISELDLCVLNNEEPTYIHPNGSTSVIDLSLCCPSLFLELDWLMHDDLCGSDHFPIVIERCSGDSEKDETWNFKKADWANFQNKCDIALNKDQIFLSDDPIQTFTDRLLAVASETIPKRKLQPHRPKTPWFTKECKEAIKNRKRAQRKFFRNPSTENALEFKRLKAKARSVIKTSKKASWQHFCTNINSKTSPTKVWKSIRKIGGNRKSSGVKHLKVQGKLITDKKSISNLLAETISKNSSSSNYSKQFQDIKKNKESQQLNFSSDNSEKYNVPFSMSELKQSLQKATSSAAGPDNLHYELLTHLPYSGMKTLLEIYNHVWISNIFPPSWRRATVIPIPKPGKVHTDPTNYRPIALTSCLCKTMERMVNGRLMWVLEDRDLLAKEQCGFRKDHSTTDHLVRLESFVREAFANNQQVVAVFFDLEKAYDRTWKYGILSDLFDLDFRGRLPTFIEGFLSERLFDVRVGSTLSQLYKQEMGVPQGSILSPILFNIKINNIIKHVTKGLDASLFVDDFALCIRGSRLSTLERTMQLCIDRINQWVVENGFKFSASKTVCMHFTKKRGICDKPSITLENTELQVVEEAKFLGLIFDKRLTFKSHVSQLRKKCEKALDILRVVGHTDWGADKVTLLHLYRALIRSKLDYGCIVYGSASKSVLQMLNTVHHQGLRIALGAFRTSPVKSLYAEAKEPSLESRRTKLTLNYVLKLKSCPDNPAYNCVFHPPNPDLFTPASLTPPLGIRILSHLENSEIPLKSVQNKLSTKTPPWLFPTPNVDLSLTSLKKGTTPPTAYKQAFLELSESYDGYTHIFTDGSKINEKSAAAAIVGKNLRDPLSCRLPDHSSIYSAELQAILLALKHVHYLEKRKFLVLSDSLSVLQALCHLKTDHPLLSPIFEILFKLKNEDKLIVFVWVPSHVDIKGNEAADQTAKQALSKTPLKIKIPYTDLKPHVQQYVFSIWQEEWDEEVHNKLNSILPRLNEFLPSVCETRRQQTILTRLRIGHTFFTHGFILRGEDPPFCVACDCPITVKHILLECADLLDQRNTFYDCSSLYDLFRHVPFVSICKFLKEINVISKI